MEKTMDNDNFDHPICRKIDENVVTIDDFNKLIAEATPEAVRDRIRRRTNHNVSDSHIDDDGHQRLELPTMAARIQPKRERADNTQMHGLGKAGHRQSTRTQRRKARQHTESVDINTTIESVAKILEQCTPSNKLDQQLVSDLQSSIAQYRISIKG